MASGSLLALFDDIATLLDDISVLSKVAVKKTSGILGDDLAVNAEQVSGVRAARELPVVWAVAKGSFKNKFIIVPVVLTLSVLMPWLITPVLMVGGIYLCFEGAEKVWRSWKHRGSKEHHELQAMMDERTGDLVAYEKEKIKGAIRTDFILSIEIIVIALGSVQDAPFVKQCIAVSVVALAITVFVYGLVALIVKLDDMGLYLLKLKNAISFLGRFLLWLAPTLMKLLAIVGTAAMFLVGGGILTHGIEHYLGEAYAIAHLIHLDSSLLNDLMHILANALFGLVVGGIAVFAASFLHESDPVSQD